MSKSLLLAAVLTLTPYPSGSASVLRAGVAAEQAVQPRTERASDPQRSANPWAVAGLLLAVMVLGAVRRR